MRSTVSHSHRHVAYARSVSALDHRPRTVVTDPQIVSDGSNPAEEEVVWLVNDETIVNTSSSGVLVSRPPITWLQSGEQSTADRIGVHSGHAGAQGMKKLNR